MGAQGSQDEPTRDSDPSDRWLSCVGFRLDLPPCSTTTESWETCTLRRQCRLPLRAELGRKPGLLIGCISRQCRYSSNRSNREKGTATSLMHVTGETLSMKSQGNLPSSTHSSRNAPRHPEALGRTCWGSLGHPRAPQTGSEPRDSH